MAKSKHRKKHAEKKRKNRKKLEDAKKHLTHLKSQFSEFEKQRIRQEKLNSIVGNYDKRVEDDFVSDSASLALARESH